MEQNKWWGYIHTNGSIQSKRFFSQQDIDEAYESPFCDIVIEPFEAKDRDHAIEIIKQKYF